MVAVEIAIGEQVELHFLDPTFQVAASAADALIEDAPMNYQRLERGDDQSLVRAFGQMLGLADDPPSSRPALAGAISEIHKQPFGATAGTTSRFGLSKLRPHPIDQASIGAPGRRRSRRDQLRTRSSTRREPLAAPAALLLHKLNAEGISGPAGSNWRASTIHDNRRRGTGNLNNELYIGRLI